MLEVVLEWHHADFVKRYDPGVGQSKASWGPISGSQSSFSAEALHGMVVYEQLQPETWSEIQSLKLQSLKYYVVCWGKVKSKKLRNKSIKNYVWIVRLSHFDPCHFEPCHLRIRSKISSNHVTPNFAIVANFELNNFELCVCVPSLLFISLLIQQIDCSSWNQGREIEFH